MPGRPRKMAEATTDLEESALWLWRNMLATCPKQYIERPTTDDPLCKLWIEALEGTEAAMFACQALADRLRKRAHIVDPGPVADAGIRDPEEHICLNCMAAHRRVYAGIEPAVAVDGCPQGDVQTVPAAAGEAKNGR